MKDPQKTIAEVQELLSSIAINPTSEDKVVLRSAASMLLEIATGKPLAKIEGECFRAGLNHEDQPNFDPR